MDDGFCSSSRRLPDDSRLLARVLSSVIDYHVALPVFSSSLPHSLLRLLAVSSSLFSLSNIYIYICIILFFLGSYQVVCRPLLFRRAGPCSPPMLVIPE